MPILRHRLPALAAPALAAALLAAAGVAAHASARRLADATTPLASLAAPVASRSWALPFWVTQETARTPLWHAALAYCLDRIEAAFPACTAVRLASWWRPAAGPIPAAACALAFHAVAGPQTTPTGRSTVPPSSSESGAPAVSTSPRAASPNASASIRPSARSAASNPGVPAPAAGPAASACRRTAFTSSTGSAAAHSARPQEPRP